VEEEEEEVKERVSIDLILILLVLRILSLSHLELGVRRGAGRSQADDGRVVGVYGCVELRGRWSRVRRRRHRFFCLVFEKSGEKR
jgi:hypothetical protein